ncbi:MAG: ATP-binding cassette domain-containing protein [Clostridia bacterium]|nr:ATP-binding cassette domain-containing protein [Clostridia bacterium]
MLELKDLSKTYKPKKGVPVQALKGINLSFDETGLVFVLGKSGSGKSTLLNLIGGLDSADEGEIIIKGRPSKDFNTADYDAYRNTYIGFVFQEYNILNEFTVGENIMLALELQNKKADRQKLDEILKEVDLEGYADRKPNELSGGQKQRVAIARALIKQPQILMADEPTGALDSNTGKAIFDTLKKISNEKLVIVVSHDREFAEEYGDRVIELADGEVISDVSKIGDKGFEPTDNQDIKNKNGKYDGREKFVKSRLPYRHALKMGAISIKSKPLRLAVTILLCFVTFALFGVVDVINAFNSRKVLVNAYTDDEYKHLAFTTTTKDIDGGDCDLNGVSEEDLIKLNSISSQNVIGATYLNNKGETKINGFLSEQELSGSDNSIYYSKCLYGFIPASKEFFDSQGFELTGELPAKENEIILTQYILEQINIAGIILKIAQPERPDKVSKDVIPNKNRTAKDFVDGEYYIDLDGQEFKIVGIVDTKADPQGKYESLKPSTMTTSRSEEKTLFFRECEEYFKFGYHSLGFISPIFYQRVVESHKVDMTSWDSFGRPMKGKFQYSYSSGSFKVVASDKDLDKTAGIYWLDGKERTSLQDNEIVVGLNLGVKLLGTDYESSLIYKHYKSEYFDGIVTVEDVSFFDLTRGLQQYLACLEEAERIDINKLDLFKNYIKEKGVWALETCFWYINGSELKIDSSLLEYDFDLMNEAHWRLAYAGYLKIDSVHENIGTPQNPIYVDMDGGYNSNITGLPNGKTIIEIDGDRLYVQGKIALGNVDVINTNNINWNANDIDTYKVLPSNYEYWSIVGIYVPRTDYPELENGDTVVFNNALYNRAENLQEVIYNFALVSTPLEKNELLALIDLHLGDNGVRNLRINNNASYILYRINIIVYAIKLIMILVGIGVALFSILLMSNYIATSISNRKRDIGILRALGAKTSDVFSIFVNESIIMALINGILSIFVALGATLGINKYLQGKFAVQFTILNFGVRQIAIVMLISVVTAVLSSLIPIYRLSKKKPIDCIQDK